MPSPFTAILIENSYALTSEEFCRAIAIDETILLEMVEYQIIHPQGVSIQEWRFDSTCLRRGRIAASFFHDLEINMPGVALALELLERIEQLQKI